MRTFLILIIALTSIVQAAQAPIAKTTHDRNLKWAPCPGIFPKGCEISILQGDPKQKSSDVFLRVPGNYRIPPHTHTSAEHITLISGSMEVKYKDRPPFVLNQGTYVFGPANHAHESRCTSKEPCVLLIGFDQPIDAKAYDGKL